MSSTRWRVRCRLVSCPMLCRGRHRPMAVLCRGRHPHQTKAAPQTTQYPSPPKLDVGHKQRHSTSPPKLDVAAALAIDTMWNNEYAQQPFTPQIKPEKGLRHLILQRDLTTGRSRSRALFSHRRALFSHHGKVRVLQNKLMRPITRNEKKGSVGTIRAPHVAVMPPFLRQSIGKDVVTSHHGGFVQDCRPTGIQFTTTCV